ncbi:ubiquitin carboxyl-terminal hydrolase CYLD isoform X2 [Lampris incognitus]|uniref:ubiquitin carboxyl-terminal hydrolase CYLD isoform X2 n=1 Tax=Lampris incognitus TaxID=2546036 RepID=UPI0024B5B476|nr:ubiquitin carboxyl-terminal hydrolase CYLD isoform X2 [Lampris incognitus]
MGEGNQKTLRQLATLPLGSPLWVHIGQPDELAEAELRYLGPLTRGSSAVFFGVQLKGSAMGRGIGNGSHKGHQLFVCPEASALFLPVSHIRLRRWSRGNGSEDEDRPREREQDRLGTGDHHSNGHHSSSQHPNHHVKQQHNVRSSFHRHRPSQLSTVSILPRTTESAPLTAQAPVQVRVRGPTSPLPIQVGQRVCFPLEDTIHGGEVCFCGPLPGRTSPMTYVGVLLDAPVGNWDGFYKGERLCHIPSHLYGQLLPITKVSPEPRARRLPVPVLNPKPVLKPIQPIVPKLGPASPPTFTPKIALLPPQPTSAKQALKPPPLSPPKHTHQPQLPPPVPPPKPQAPPSPPVDDQPQASNGAHAPPSPLRSPGISDDAGENGETGLEVELEVGSMVEVNDPPLYGVIRWIGRISGIPELVAGIELDQELTAGTDGSYLGERHFRCPANKGLFVKLRNCRRDSRFPIPETPVNQVERCNSIAFADWGSERVEEHTPSVEGEEARDLYQGWKRGIQGHLNSCYLDASLFSLFSCCSSADWVLLWPTDSQTAPNSTQAQDLLRCEIVNPMRRFGYVCASKTMALRRLLEAENNNTGFTNQEKDPEEFLNKLFQLLRVEPLLKIRSTSRQPQECHLYQLFPPSIPSSATTHSPSLSPVPLCLPSAGRMRVATIQTLLESSFLHAGLKFVEAPSCLLLLTPRFGKDFKMFDAILPTLSLDITDLLDDTLRQCSICQAVAEWECLQCYEDLDITPGRLKQYCHTCNTQVHSHKKRVLHSPEQVGIPGGPWTGPLHGTRQRLALFAVTCIETSHYVSFVKHGPRPMDWLFFDSMADREGGENGFNIPQVRACPEVGRYLSLSEEELSRLDPASLPEHTRRLLCDSYMCLYHSPELSLYK